MSSAPTLPQLLSTSEFESAIQELAPRVAVFDCDGTLWSGDAGSGFMRFSVETELLSPEKISWLQERYEGYKRGEVSELSICGEMVQVYAGLRESELRAAAAEFFRSRIEANIFPELHRVVTALQAAECVIWAVSSTNDWVVEEGMQRFSIDPEHVLSARVAVDGGIVTDRIVDVPTDQGKVDALHRAGVTVPDAVFGNSVHDAAMLAIARRAFPVNPTPALAEESAARGWPIYFPGSVRPSS